jgi:RecA/RadA recombinase
MTALPADVTAAVANLQARWGAAAPRITEGALALAPVTDAATSPEPTNPEPAATPNERVVRTGFAALDAILGPGGLPRSASVAIRGDGSSGRTTLVLRLAAEAQATGAIVAWVDLARSFDPVEAVARGVRLEWLVVITPETLDEGLAIGGMLLAGRSVDLLVLDLPSDWQRRPVDRGRLAASDRPSAVADRERPASIAGRFGRLAALARRAETLFVVLEPPSLTGGLAGAGGTGSLAGAVAESASLRLELARRSWIRLGRDIVGQRTEALVARNRYGPPGRRATLRILYADGGERDACLRRDGLLIDQAPAIHPERVQRDATPPSLPAPSPPRARPGASLRTLPTRPAHPGRPAVGSGPGHRRGSGSPGTGRSTGDAARERPSARS